MSSLIIPGDWTQQPPYRAEISSGSSLSRSLCGVFYPQIGGMESVNSPRIVGVSDGLAYQGNGSSSYFWKAYAGPEITTAGTILAISHGSAGAGNSRLFALGSSTNDTPLLAILADATTPSIASSVTRSSSPISSINSGSRVGFEQTPHIIVSTFGPAGVALYLDGILCSTSATVHDFSAFNLNRIAIGAQIRTTVSSYGSSACPLAAIWNRALSASEVTEISRNPWQIFQPLPRRIFAPAAGGTSVTADGALPAASLTAATGGATGAATASGGIAASSLSAPTGSSTGSATTSGSLEAISLSATTGSAATAGSAAADGSLTVIGLTAPDATSTVSIQAQAALSAIFLTPADGSATGSAVCDGSFAPISLSACRASASNGLESAEALRKSVFLKISHPSYVIRV